MRSRALQSPIRHEGGAESPPRPVSPKILKRGSRLYGWHGTIPWGGFRLTLSPRMVIANINGVMSRNIEVNLLPRCVGRIGRVTSLSRFEVFLICEFQFSADTISEANAELKQE